MNIQPASQLLLVEDTPSLQMLYSTILRKGGYTPICASTGREALEKFALNRPRVVLLDLMLPDIDGLEVMREMLAQQPDTGIIVITADGSVDNAVQATRIGAHDFLVKPLGDIRLISAVSNAIAQHKQKDTKGWAAQAPSLDDSVFLGESAPMQDVYGKINAVAKSMAPVFFLGESGTGKELCARAVHLKSPRAAAPFIALNCAAIPVDQIEAELFGTHAKGESSAIAKANGGTLFLENISALSWELQGKMLQFLQRATIGPTATHSQIAVDVRIICAATQAPLAETRSGKFREDLFYRLYVIPIEIPPLRARDDDVNLLAKHYLAQIASEEGKIFETIAPEARAAFASYAWHGNVRELINVLRHAVVLHDGPVLEAAMLPADVTQSPSRFTPHHGQAAMMPEDLLAGQTMAEIEKLVITSAIARYDGSIPRAARELDIAPSTIYRKKDAWGDGTA